MAKYIMVQGTMSGAGKSLICAALCRIFRQDGFRVAPFKSQNMALNSYVTKDGLEMGRAQAVQAMAAGVDPDVRMNPILLKPSDEIGSQVILNGKPIGDFKAADYFKMKKSLIPKILESFESLAAENDIIVIEGAGSPAEINLKEDDIVNMGFASLVDSKVLLVGNIDPGGIFAQLYGTSSLLTPGERDRITGFLINKFRGDKELLTPGLKQLEELSGIPVYGVIPYLDISIEEEDSLSEELKKKSHEKPLDIAVIRLPFISNYTDFTPLEGSEYIGIRYVSDILDLKKPDLLIIPGSKSTISDLRWLKEKGFDACIKALSKNGTDILGICGGYQMLGEILYDPATDEKEEGLSLLPLVTEFRETKHTVQVSGRITGGPFKGKKISGYEIHMGETKLTGPEAGDDGNPDKTGYEDKAAKKTGCEKTAADHTGYETATQDHTGYEKAAADKKPESFCCLYDVESAGSISDLNEEWILNPGEANKPELNEERLSGLKEEGSGPGDAGIRKDGFYLEGVTGTYVHGLFEGGELVDALIGYYLKKRGLPADKLKKSTDYSKFREEQYDRLAEEVRKNLRMDLIYKDMQL